MAAQMMFVQVISFLIYSCGAFHSSKVEPPTQLFAESNKVTTVLAMMPLSQPTLKFADSVNMEWLMGRGSDVSVNKAANQQNQNVLKNKDASMPDFFGDFSQGADFILATWEIY